MSSRTNPTFRAPQSANYHIHTDPASVPTASNDPDHNNIIIVNSDIMILPGRQQGSQNEEDDEDDDETLSSSGRTDTSRTDSPSPNHLPLSPSSRSTLTAQRQAPVAVSLAGKETPAWHSSFAIQPTALEEPQPYSPFQSARRSHDENEYNFAPSQATAPPAAPLPPSTRPYRPIQATAAPYSTSTSIPPYQQQQHQQQALYHQHHHLNPTNGHPTITEQDHSPEVDLEMQDRSWSQSRSLQLYSSSTPMTSGGIYDPSASAAGSRGVALVGTALAASGTGRRGEGTDAQVARERHAPDSGRTARDSTDSTYTRDSHNNPSTPKHHPTRSRNINKSTHVNNTNYNNVTASDNPVSRKGEATTGTSTSPRAARTGFTSLLGRFTSSSKDRNSSSRGNRGVASGLAVNTPGTQSAAGSKNDLIHAHHHGHVHPHLRNDMVPEKKRSGPMNYQGSHATRKTGVPGRNGEEPETDMFNFVNIMLDMPEKPTLRQVTLKLAKVLAVMTISYFVLMALYFAAEFQSDSRTKNFNVMVVNLDQGLIGFNYLNFTQQLNSQPGQLNWSVQNATKYPTMAAISDEVRRGAFWGAVVVQPNASSTLIATTATPAPNYDPTKAFAFVYDGGRDPLVVKPYIVANMYTQFLLFTKIFNPAWIRLLLQLSDEKGFLLTSLQNSPQVMGTPVAFEEFDLHPLTATIITSATSVAYIWIFLVAGGSTYLVAHMIQPVTRNTSVPKTMGFLLLPLLVFLCALSMAYSILLLAFGVPFPSGGSQFMSLFAGMLLLQCAVASMVLFLIYLIPVVFIPGFTITFVVLNVIAVFNPVELMPAFYRWVYAMPFLNAVQIARYVLMGSYSRLKYNIPVLAAWILIPIVLLPFAIIRQKRLAREVQLQEEEDRIEEELRSKQLKQKQQQLQFQDLEPDEQDKVRDGGGGGDGSAARAIEDGARREGPHSGKARMTRFGVVRGQRHVVEDDFDTPGREDSSIHGRDSDDDEFYSGDGGDNESEGSRRRHIANQDYHSRNQRPYNHLAQGGAVMSGSTSPSAPSESRVFGGQRRRNRGRDAYMTDIPNEVK